MPNAHDKASGIEKSKRKISRAAARESNQGKKRQPKEVSHTAERRNIQLDCRLCSAIHPPNKSIRYEVSDLG